MKRRTVYAYPTIWSDLDSSDCGDFQYPSTVWHETTFAHVAFINTLQQSTESVISTFSCISLQDLHTTVADGYDIVLHLLLASYFSDLPDAEEIPGVQRSNKTHFFRETFLLC